ncbi:MAG: GWxTD domain-containing protein [Candidatus Neomarinimicrobiota bacterium]
MKRNYFLPLLIFMLISSALYAQIGERGKWKIGPEYKIEHVVKPSAEIGKGELFLDLSLAYDEIHFVKKDDRFKGRFDVSIMIFKDKKKVISESWIERLTLNEFKMTNSRKELISLKKSYVLDPGKYRLEVLITDLKTQNRRKQVRDIDMTSLTQGSWMLGDLYFVKDSSKMNYNKGMPEVIFVGFTASGIEGKHDFYYSIQSRDATVSKAKFSIDLSKKKREYIFPVLTKDLNYNQYYLKLETVIDSQLYSRSIPMRVDWGGTSALIPDLEDAIDQMKYLSYTGYFPARDLKRVQKATGDEQKKFFTEIWKKIDPTPGTETNELMNEYYYRVHVANQRFSGHREGWRSDRGMIYILYGEPDAVEEYNFEINSKPYMIWLYYSVNRRFVFIDNTGFGDYQLSQPLSEY